MKKFCHVLAEEKKVIGSDGQKFRRCGFVVASTARRSCLSFDAFQKKRQLSHEGALD